jgi:hypothetical protein
MDPNIAAVITGLLANGLTALIAAGAAGPAPARARQPYDLKSLLAAPAAELARRLPRTEPVQGERLRHFLVSADAEALLKRLFTTRWSGAQNAAIDTVRADFRALYAELPGQADGPGTADEADALFAALLDACDAAIAAAIEHNLLAAHEAKSAQRHHKTSEQLTRIETKVEQGFDALTAPNQQPPDAPAPAATPVPMPPGILAVRLTPSLDGGTRLDYLLKDASPPPRRWDKTQTDALRQAAAGPGPDGEHLFDRLFGPWPQSAELFRALFADHANHADHGDPQPSPVRKEARLRIITADPELLCLPWGRLTWQGRRLIDYDWEIVTAAAPLPRHQCRTAPAAELVVVTDPPPPPDTPRPAARRVTLKTLLADQRPAKTGRVREVAGADALAAVLADAPQHPPHALFIELACDLQDGQPVLLFGADPPQPYPLAALEATLLRAEPAPRLLVLALRGADAATQMARLTALLGERIALILCLAPPPADAAADPARDTLLRLLPAWLREGRDPVHALHRLLRAAPGPGAGGTAGAPCDPGLIGIHAHYRSWETTPCKPDREDLRALLTLDRDKQKGSVEGMLKDLVQPNGDRVLLILAYGTPDNLVAELSAQLQDHLDLHMAGQAALKGQFIGLPEVPLPQPDDDALDEAVRRLHGAFEPHLKETLRAAPEEGLGDLIRRHMHKGLGPAERAVLWLDWGHIPIPAAAGAPRAAAGLKTNAAVRALLRWCAETLNGACPPKLRVVCILSVQVPAEDDYADLADLLHALEEQEPDYARWFERDGFAFLHLEPLERVDRAHLRRYLRKIDTGLDEHSRAELTRLILKRSEHRFEPTVALLDQGHSRGWGNLLEDLQQRQRPPQPRKRRGLFS